MNATTLNHANPLVPRSARRTARRSSEWDSHTFGIGYDDDIEEATDIIIIEETHKHPEILDDPAPTVRMSTDSALADSFVGLTARIWIADPNRADYLGIRGDFITSVKQRFNDAGIDIPYPHVDLSGDVGASETSALQLAKSDQ